MWQYEFIWSVFFFIWSVFWSVLFDQHVFFSDQHKKLHQQNGGETANGKPRMWSPESQRAQNQNKCYPLPGKMVSDTVMAVCYLQGQCFNTFPVFLSGHQYSKVRQALHSSYPDNLLCREKEITEIRSFLQNHLPKRKPGSLYISGAPGTGKTACLTKIMLEMKVQYCCSLQIRLVYNHLLIFYFFRFFLSFNIHCTMITVVWLYGKVCTAVGS